MDRKTARRPNPLTSGIVQGDPIPIGQRELIPVVRMTTYTRRQATVATERLAGQGVGLLHLTPIAVLERGPDGERRIPIRDRTSQLLNGIVLAAIIIPLLLTLAIQLARKSPS